MHKAALFRLETLFELALIVAGIAIIVVSKGYGFGSLARPGPGLYPSFIGGVIALAGAAVLVARLRSGEHGFRVERSAGFTLLFMSLTFGLWILLMPWLGYVIVTLLATLAFAKIMRLEGWTKPVALAAGTALFIYLLFDHWLYVDLPRGILG